MNIVFCTDKNLIRQAAVLVSSVIHNNQSEDINFYAILLDVEKKDIELLKKSISGKSTLQVYEVCKEDFTSLPVHMSYITLGTYLRFFIESKLPLEVQKVLYLDVDIVVAGSLKNFYDENISGFSVAAALDVENADIRRYNRLDYPMSDGYFNAGVLLINLDYWRKNHISEKALKFLTDFSEKCQFHDQDALNHILHGTVKFISNKYNAMYDFFNANPDDMLIEKSLLLKTREELKEPVIIHYAGPFKPWQIEFYKYSYPFGKLWQRYKDSSNVDIRLKHFRRKESFYTIKKILSFLGLRKDSTLLLRKNYIDTSTIEEKLLFP